MKQNIIRFLRDAYPFVLTIALWRLACSWLNPGGILAIIPIYYCSFVRPTRYFLTLSVIFCFLLDYKLDTVFMVTLVYCLYYSVMNIQTVVDLTHTNRDGLFAFMVFFGVIVGLLIIQDINILNLCGGVFVFAVACALYTPIIKTITAVKND